MFLQKTSYNTIAIWTPSNITGYNKPIILSTGTGIEDFINFDQPPTQIVQRQTLNRNIYSYQKPTLITGNVTFHVASDALSAIKDITLAQQTKGLPISGITTIITIGSATYTKYTNWEWTSSFTGANLNKVASDVIMYFSASPPTQISLGSIISVGTSLAGLGII